MRISFYFSAKDLRTSLLIVRNCSFLTLLYIGGTYARSVYTWYINIFRMIAVLIIFFAAKKKESDEKKSKLNSDKTETRQCYC